jgi:uncharacterized membrane protein
MVHNRTTNFGNLAAQFFHGSIALASVTLAFFRLDVDFASTAFVYLIVMVLFALMVVVAFLLTSWIVMRLIRSARGRTEAALQAEACLRRREAYLHDSEKQWRELFERNPVIYFTIDATATVPSVNSFVSGLITFSGTSKEND